MHDLKLTPGPCLLRSRPEKSADGRYHPVTDDVTSRAHEFLFDEVALDPGVTVRDIFLLLQKAPLLVDIYRQHFAKELLEHVLSAPPQVQAPGYSPQGIEYLELYHVWHFNTGEQSLQPTGLYRMHGVGYELREDLDMGDYVEPKGSRPQWGVSLTDARDMLHLPVRVNPTVMVCEDDLDARAYGQVLRYLEFKGCTLGGVIHSLLWWLSFHGAPSDQADVLNVVEARMDELEASEDPDSLTVSADDFFGDMYRPGIIALFESIGSASASDVSWLLRQIDDQMPVQAGLDQARARDNEPLDLQVKAQYRDMPAYTFRKRFREARRA